MIKEEARAWCIVGAKVLGSPSAQPVISF